jgi:hypothetical protein
VSILLADEFHGRWHKARPRVERPPPGGQALTARQAAGESLLTGLPLVQAWARGYFASTLQPEDEDSALVVAAMTGREASATKASPEQGIRFLLSLYLGIERVLPKRGERNGPKGPEETWLLGIARWATSWDLSYRDFVARAERASLAQFERTPKIHWNFQPLPDLGPARQRAILAFGELARSRSRIGEWLSASSGSIRVMVEEAPAGSIRRVVALIRVAEEAYPELSAPAILHALRELKVDEDTNALLRSVLVPNDLDYPPTVEVDPQDGFQPRTEAGFTAADFAELGSGLAHDAGPDWETGVAADEKGLPVALGHVLTGIAAGLNRNYVAIPSGGPISAMVADSLPDAIAMDNLWTVTGWRPGYTIVDHFEKTLGAPDSEASDAELRGDLDGLVLGDFLTLNPAVAARLTANKLPLSQLLASYYLDEPTAAQSGMRPDLAGVVASQRLENTQRLFEREPGKLLEQTRRFVVLWLVLRGIVAAQLLEAASGVRGAIARSLAEQAVAWFRPSWGSR